MDKGASNLIRLFKKAHWSIIDRTLESKCCFDGGGGRLFGINILLGAMTRMQQTNVTGLMWSRWQPQECSGAVETAAALIGLVEFLTVELWGVGTSGLWFVVSTWRAFALLHRNRVIDLFFWHALSDNGPIKWELNCFAAPSETQPH